MRLWDRMALVKYVLKGVGWSSITRLQAAGDLPRWQSAGNGTGRTSQGWRVSAFQYPLEFQVSAIWTLRVAYNSRRKQQGLEELDSFDLMSWCRKSWKL